MAARNHDDTLQQGRTHIYIILYFLISSKDEGKHKLARKIFIQVFIFVGLESVLNSLHIPTDIAQQYKIYNTLQKKIKYS